MASTMVSRWGGVLLGIAVASVCGCSSSKAPPFSSASGGAGTSGAGGVNGLAGSAAGSAAGAPEQPMAGASGTGSGVAGSAAGGTTGAAGTGAAGTGAAGTTGIAGGGGAISDVLPSSGCGKDPGQASGSRVRYTIQTAGTKAPNCADKTCGAWSYVREYYVQLPTGYDQTKPYPLIFEGPGCGGTGNNLYALSDLAGVVIRVGLSPSVDAQAIHSTNPGQGCFDDKDGDSSVDWPFYEGVYDQLAATVCFDRNRVFAGGNSSGAWLANELGCKYAGDAARPIRGVMANTGGLPTDARYVPTCTRKPMAGFWSWQTSDITPASNIVAINRALQVNGCSPSGVTYASGVFPPFAISASDSTSCKKLDGCPDLYPVVVCPVPGNGHDSLVGVVNPGWCSFLKLFSALPVVCGAAPNPVCQPATTRCSGPGKQQTCDATGQWGADMTCPTACVTRSSGVASCGNPKTVFTTSLTYAISDLGSVANADKRCQEIAVGAGLGGQYKAWLSDSKSSPSKTFTRTADPYVLVDGTVVADSWADLTSGSLRHPISLTETGGSPPVGVSTCDGGLVWSATTTTGDLDDPAYTCGNWTNARGTQSEWGSWSAQDGSWTVHCTGGNSAQNACGTTSMLYCFQQ